MRGLGPKSSVCPSKPGKPNFSGGISRDFAGISQSRPKSLRKIKFVFNFWLLEKGLKCFFANIGTQQILGLYEFYLFFASTKLLADIPTWKIKHNSPFCDWQPFGPFCFLVCRNAYFLVFSRVLLSVKKKGKVKRALDKKHLLSFPDNMSSHLSG